MPNIGTLVLVYSPTSYHTTTKDTTLLINNKNISEDLSKYKIYYTQELFNLNFELASVLWKNKKIFKNLFKYELLDHPISDHEYFIVS